MFYFFLISVKCIIYLKIKASFIGKYCFQIKKNKKTTKLFWSYEDRVSSHFDEKSLKFN